MPTTDHTGTHNVETSTLPPFIRIEAAAEMLDCSPDTIRRMISRGEIRARRIGRKLLRVETASLLEAGAPIKAAK